MLEKLSERNYELLYCEETGQIYGGDQETKEINGLKCSETENVNLKDKTIN